MANVDTNTCILRRDKSYFVKKKKKKTQKKHKKTQHSDSTKQFSETDIIKMLEFFY